MSYSTLKSYTPLRRTALARGTSRLAPSPMPPRTRPIRRQSARAAAREARLAETKRQMIAERGPWCEIRIPGVCTGLATDACHVAGRDHTGANDTPDNLYLGCRACHVHTHNHSAEAYASGTRKRRNGVANG